MAARASIPQPTDELFPGFSTQTLRIDGGHVFARVGGSGPPLLLLHGYPQTHVCWHMVAPRLAAHHTVVLCDLPGYGASDAVPRNAGQDSFDKRTMAATVVTTMHALGFSRFAVVGHDRGGRVAYRLALDHPQTGWTVDRLHDQADLDAGRLIDCPVLVVWGGAEFPDAADVLLSWQRIAKHVTGRELPCGHFAPEEEPDSIYVTLQSFLAEHGMAPARPRAGTTRT